MEGSYALVQVDSDVVTCEISPLNCCTGLCYEMEVVPEESGPPCQFPMLEAKWSWRHDIELVGLMWSTPRRASRYAIWPIRDVARSPGEIVVSCY